MRFYTDIRETKYIFLRELLGNSAISFANDYIYFTIKHFGLCWTPYRFAQKLGVYETLRPGPRSHTLHPLSHLSRNIQIATKLIFQNVNKEDFASAAFEIFASDDVEDKLAYYVDIVNKMNDRLVASNASMCEVMFCLASVGRWTVSFYKLGVKDAAHIAPALISSFLWKLEAFYRHEIYQLLDYSAIDIITWFQKNKDEI